LSSAALDIARFAIGFDERDRDRLHALWDEVLDSGQWSHGEMNRRFEAAWAELNGMPALALGSWSGGAVAALTFAGVKGEAVLCASLADIEAKIAEHKPRACVLVHIGGHLAFRAREIAELCRSEDVFLLEDCAHAHGATWNGQAPGDFGDAGVYSLYATKTISTGEGGVLVSRNEDLLTFARAYRDYGKPDYDVAGLNIRMSEFTAALGLIQTERLPEIVAWKNTVARELLDAEHPGRLQLPDRMVSGLYKYIVFDPIEKSTGKVYDQPCHRIMNTADELPNTDWVAENHWCVPLYYRPETT
jgi:perosamine synthetase